MSWRAREARRLQPNTRVLAVAACSALLFAFPLSARQAGAQLDPNSPTYELDLWYQEQLASMSEEQRAELENLDSDPQTTTQSSLSSSSMALAPSSLEGGGGAMAMMSNGFPDVYHSTACDGTAPDPNIPDLSGQGLVTLSICLNGGSIASAPDPNRACIDGDGEELCGWRVQLYASEDLTFTSFTPEPNAPIDTWEPQSGISTKLSIIGGVQTTPVPEQIPLGDLVVDATGAASGAVNLGLSQTVGADLTLNELDPALIATVPEPHSLLTLGIGAGALLALSSRRRI